MPFLVPIATAIAGIIPTCVNDTLSPKPKESKKKHALLLHLDNSGSEANSMNGLSIYDHEQEQCKKYAIEQLNSCIVNEVYIATWNSTSTIFVKLEPIRHLITKKVTGFSNWALPQPSGGTTPSNAFIEAEKFIKKLEPGYEVEYVIATDGTEFDGNRGEFQQKYLVDACKKLMSLKNNVSMTVIGIIPTPVNYANITESQPIPGLTLANLLFLYVSKCMMCSGNETSLTTVFQKTEQTSSSGILFCNEFRLPHGINIIAFLTELVSVVQLHIESLTMEQYDILLDSVVSLCVLQLKGIMNPLTKKVQWFEQVKRAMITLGTTVYCKADPTLTEQQVKDAVTEKFTENFIQVSQGSTRLCSGEFIKGKQTLFQEVSAQLKASGTLSHGADKALFIVHDHTTGSYTFVRISDPNIRNKLCTVQGMPFSGFNNLSLALPDITDPSVLAQQGQVIRQGIRGSGPILIPKFVGDFKDSIFIFVWGVEWVKGMLSGLPTNCDHMDILKLLFCTMADKKVMGRDNKESTLLQEWKKGIFPERLDDGRSILQIVSSPFLDIKGIEPHDMEGLLFVLVGVFDLFVKQEQICTLRVRMGLQHTPSCAEFLAYVGEKYAHLKGTVSTSPDVPFFSHAPYSPYQTDFIDLADCEQLWSVLPHTNVHGSVCDVKHQDGGFHCTNLERMNMMQLNGGKCPYCRMGLMPGDFEKVEGGWPTLETFLNRHIPVGPEPPATSAYVAPQHQHQHQQHQHQQQPQAGGGASAQPRPQISYASTTSGQQVPEMPKKLSNNRRKTWAKYEKLYNKTRDPEHLAVLLKMVEEEKAPTSLASP
jgi:hypothetical protein